jgi:hypothetical protein
MTDVVLAFDVEDVYNQDADDALLNLCRMHTDEGLVACLFVVGERARVLRERGRHDVLAAMRRHEICYHGNYSGDFPKPALEYAQDMSWDDAVSYALSVEVPGLNDVADITGQFPVAWCAHEAQQAAPLQYALKLAGLRCWAGGPRGWLMDWLSWSRATCTLSSESSIWDYQADPTRPDQRPPVCNPAADLATLQQRFDEMAGHTDFITLVGHPQLWVIAEPQWHELSVVFRHGGPGRYPRPANFTPSQPRSPPDREAAFELTRRVLRWLKSRADVNLTTYSQLCEREEEPPCPWLTMDQALSLAQRLSQRLTYVADFGTTFAPADVWGLLTFACNYCWRQHRWPDRLPVQRLIGPTEAPLRTHGPVTLTRDEIFAGALAGYAVMMDERRVMGILRAIRQDVGPGTWIRVLTEFVSRSVEAASMPEQVTVTGGEELPEAAAEPVIRDRQFHSCSHRPGLSYAPLHDMLSWQSWSYRPARRREH